MIYKFSFFVGAAISSFFDNGLHFSWDRIKKQYKRTMYFNGSIDRLNNDFFGYIAKLNKEEAILFFNLDTYLDVTYQLFIYTKKDFWCFVKLEDNKPKYQYIPLPDTNFEEKMILLESPKNINQCIVKIKDINHIIEQKNIPQSNQEELLMFKQYITSLLFQSSYKAEL